MIQKVELSHEDPFVVGSLATINASLSPESPGATGYQWQTQDKDGGSWQDVKDQVNSSYTFKVLEGSPFSLRVRATLDGGSVVDSEPIRVETQEKALPADKDADPASVWHVNFAVVGFIVAMVLLIVFAIASHFMSRDLGLSADAYGKLDGRALLGARVIPPVALLGALTLVVGLWMVVTEWRGRFVSNNDAAAQSKGAVADVGTLVEAVGKLKGASLVLITGALILMGVAWMTSSTTNAEPSDTPTPTATATATST